MSNISVADIDKFSANISIAWAGLTFVVVDCPPDFQFFVVRWLSLEYWKLFTLHSGRIEFKNETLAFFLGFMLRFVYRPRLCASYIFHWISRRCWNLYWFVKVVWSSSELEYYFLLSSHVSCLVCKVRYGILPLLLL